MTKLLARKVTPRAPFTLKDLPLTSRFHRFAMRQRSSRKAQLLINAPLEKIFNAFYRWMPGRPVGTLEFREPQGTHTIRFNARNLAFDMFYSDIYAENYEDETGVLIDALLPL